MKSPNHSVHIQTYGYEDAKFVLSLIQFENSIIEFCIVPYSISTRLYWMKIPSNQNNFGDKVLHANADYSVWNEMGSFEVLYHFSLVDYKVISIVSR